MAVGSTVQGQGRGARPNRGGPVTGGGRSPAGPPRKARDPGSPRGVAEAAVPPPTEGDGDGPIGAGRHGRPPDWLAVAVSPVPRRGPEGRLARDVGQRE